MVSALFSIYGNVSDVEKLTQILLAVYIFSRKGKFINFTQENVSTIELLHPTYKMLKKGLWQNNKQLVWCCSHDNHY